MNTIKSVYRRVAAWRGTDWVVLALGAVILSAISLPIIGRSSIWFDEAFSAYITRFNFWEIAKYTAADVHPPLYYWTLKLWEMLFGTTDVAIRSLSLLFALVAMLFAFLTARRLFGRRAAALSVLLIALSPMVVRYSIEARMYMMVAAITMMATYVLTYAINSRGKRPWIIYGILVSIGMWTHYFAALVWLAHWLWRFIVVRQTGVRGKELLRKFFSTNWIMAHVIAIAGFAVWLPVMVKQLGGIQGTGFWIGPVSINTPTNYMTNLFYYQEHEQVTGWYAVALLFVIMLLTVLVVKTYRSMTKNARQNYLLLIILSLVPVGLLMVASLPPAHSSFVERYVMPSIVVASILMAVTIVYGLAGKKLRWRIATTLLIIAMLVVGIGNVYYYGNYNKNSQTDPLTKQLIQKVIAHSQPGEPIIANSPWVFYNAIFYATKDHPVYFIDADTNYNFGSEDMLKYNSQYKITDIGTFLHAHPVVWYIGVTSDPTVSGARTVGWQALQTLGVYDRIDNVTVDKATEYQTQ